MRRRLAHVVAISLLAGSAVLVGASPAAATDVGTPAEFVAAWEDPDTTLITLTASIALGCGEAPVTRDSATDLVVTGPGVTLSNTCGGGGIGVPGTVGLVQDGVGRITFDDVSYVGNSGSGHGLQTNGDVAVESSAVEGHGLDGTVVDAIHTTAGDVVVTDSTLRANATGIRSESGDVTVTDSMVTEGRTNSTGVRSASGDVTVIDSTVSDILTAISSTSGHITVTGATIGSTDTNIGTGILSQTGDVTVTDSTISNYVFLYGIWSNGGGAVTVTGSTLTSDPSGSTLINGILVDGFNESTLTVTDSTVSGSGGSGISVLGNTSEVTVHGSTVAENVGTGLFTSDQAEADVEIVNSTIVGNATGVRSGSGAVALAYSTITDNEGFGIDPTPVFGGPEVPFELFGTILAANGDNCAGSTLSSAGFNWSDDLSCTLGGPGDMTDVGGDPQLGPLADNGGSTQTRLPLPTSQLVNAIPLASCQAGLASDVTTDQRGLPRPGGAGCDTGAVEVQETVTYTARYSDHTCGVLENVALAFGLDSAEDVVRLGTQGLVGVAEAGDAEPIADPPANDGPCEITVSWPADEAASLADAAAAWGLDEDQLHHLGGRIVLVLLWIAIVTGGG